MENQSTIFRVQCATLVAATVLVGGLGTGAPLAGATPAVQSPEPPDAEAARPASQASASFGASASAAHPELQWLRRRVGTWDVTMTMRLSADADPVIVTGLIAERTAMGPYLQEVMKPAPGSSLEPFQRTDYLTYNTLQGRWQYLSMDTRATVGLMYAQGTGADGSQDITVHFSDAPGPSELGPALAGRFMRARHVLTRESDDREVVRQYWTFPGSPEWLAVQYAYSRRRATP